MLRLISQEPGSGIKLLIVRCKNAALAHNYGFRAMEAEACHISQCPRMLTMIQTAHTFSSILDNADTVFPCNGVKLIHFAGMSIEVDSNDRPGPGRDGSLYGLWIDRPVIPADIHKYRRCTSIGHCVRGSDPGTVREDHFIAGLDPKSQQGKMQRRSTGGRRDRIFNAQNLTDCLFKLL